MPSAPRFWTVVGLLGLSANSVNSGAIHDYPHYSVSSCSTTVVTLPTTYATYPNSNVTVVSPTTVVSVYPTTVVSEYSTTVTSEYSVPYPTTILDTTTTTTTVSVPVTIISNATVYYPTVVPTTEISITTVIVPTTITPPVSYTTIVTPTTITATEEECPTTCSIAAGTVQLFFWPTNNDYTYPSTYVETGLDYTFTSPSVYLLINTIYGTNSIGRAGPSGTSEVFALDLNEVSTLDPKNQATRQLTLNDLYTNCPQAIDPAVIATTIPDGHCDFSLVAPQVVKQWASPCNACGRLGLFDPPYAIPTLGGGLIPTTITTTNVETTTFATTTSPASGATSTIVTATTTTVVQTTETSAVSSSSNSATASSSTTSDPTTVPTTSATASSSTTSDSTTVPTASATRVTGLCGILWLLVSYFVVSWL